MSRRRRRSRGRPAPPALSQDPATPADDRVAPRAAHAGDRVAPSAARAGDGVGPALRPGSAAELAYEASPLRRLAVGVLCAKIALVVLVFDPDALNVFSQPKALVAHASAYVLVGLLVAVALSHGRAMLRWSPLHVPVVAYVGAYLLATVFALDQRVALFGAPDRSLGLITALDSVLIYASVVALVRTRADLLWLGGTLAGTTVLVLGYALFQKLGLDPIPWASGLTEARPQATLGNPGVLAQYMGSTAASAAAVVMATRGRPRRAAAAMLLGALLGIWLAGARAAVIGAVAAAAVLLAPPLLRRAGRATRVTGTLGLSLFTVVLAGTLSVTVLAGPSTVLTRSPSQILEALSAGGGTITGRLDIYRVALEAVLDRPVVGIGPDNYVVAFPAYRAAAGSGVHESGAAQSSAHSWFWKVFTDAGILGLAGFLASLTIAAALAMRSSSIASSAALGAIAAWVGTGLVSINHVATEWIPWLAFGVIATGAAGGGAIGSFGTAAVPKPRRRSSYRPTDARLRTAVLLGVAALLALLPLRTLQASHLALDAREAYALGERGERAMLAAAQAAVSLDGERAEYLNLLGLAQFGMGQFLEASEAFEAAAERAPYEWTYQTNRARALMNLGVVAKDRSVVAESLRIVRETAGAHQFVADVQEALAVIASTSRQYEEAVRAGETALQYAGGATPELARAVGRSYLRLERPADAARWLRLGIEGRSPEATFELRILLIDALLGVADRAGAAEQLVAVRQTVPSDPRIVDLQETLIEHGASNVLITETFDRAPTWTVEVGEIGAVAENVILVDQSAGSWRGTVAEIDAPAVRLSFQFRFGRQSEADRALEVGRRIDGGRSVVVQHLIDTWRTRIVRREDGSEVELGARNVARVEPGLWYWAEIEITGDRVTVLWYRSGIEPRSKASSTLLGALSAELGAVAGGSGPLFIAVKSSSPFEIGGVARRPGGLYVERVAE